jgi:uncharacterized protein YbcI
MPGFEFRYRLNGGPPTVHSVRAIVEVSAGDLVNMDDGAVAVAVAATGDTSLVGAALDRTRPAGRSRIRVITDGDAVYAVDDGEARRAGETVALTGGSGGQGIASGAEEDLSIVVDSRADEETLVRIRDGRHRAMGTSGSGTQLTGGELNAAVTRAVVRLHREHTGRGPTRAQAFYRGNVMVVIMYDALTRAEGSLAGSGRTDMVLQVRMAFQDTMRAELIALVESFTGCAVEAFMSTNHIQPDMAAEIFVLDRPVPGDESEQR